MTLSTEMLRVLIFIYLSLPATVFMAPPQADVADTFYTRATELARAGNFHLALLELEKAAELAPNNPKVHNLLGVVLTQLGRLEEADEAYNRALSLTSNFFPARKNRAVNAFTRGDFKLAAGEFEALARLVPGDFVPHLFLGLLSIEAANSQKAYEHLIQARQLSPENGKVLLAITKVYFALGERKSALESARQMRVKSLGTDAEQFELGVLLAQFEANVEAAEIFQELWLKNPASYDIGFNLALLQYRSSQMDAALRTVETLSSARKPSGELLNLRGWIYNKMRRLDKARESLEMAIAAEPSQPDHYLDLSTVLYNQGNTPAAVQLISEALQRNIEQDRFQVRLGLLNEKIGNDTEAEKWYAAALRINSRNRAAYLALAHLMSATHRQPEALDLLAQAIQFLPADAFLHYKYGEQLLESEPESLEKTASILKKALELNPFYANTHYLLGKLYLKKGNDDLAQSAFEKACAFNPNHVSAYHQLSLIARRQGKKERATELGRIVQKLNEQEDKSFQEDFLGMAREGLRGSTGGAVVSRPAH